MKRVTGLLALLMVGIAVSSPARGEGGLVRHAPPPDPVLTPAEFDPVQAVLIRWKSGDVADVCMPLIESIREAGAEVCVLVDDAEARADFAAEMAAMDLSMSKVRVLLAPTDSKWTRDYSAASVYWGPQGKLGFVDWHATPDDRPLDDASPIAVAQTLKYPLFRADRGASKLVIDGGDFVTDGFGTAFLSTWVVNDNDDLVFFQDAMRRYMGMERLIVLDKLERGPTNHIDMYLRLLDEETILVGRYDPGAPGDEIIERNVAYLETLTSCYGNPYRIVRIPMPGNTRVRDFRTYTNALIVNNHILVPIYGAARDKEALDIFSEAMPGYHVRGFDCSGIIKENGAIHCMTREINRDKIIRIGHPRFTRRYGLGETVQFHAECWSQLPVEEVTLHVRMPGQNRYTRYAMSEQDGAFRFRMNPPTTGEYRYYLSARARSLSGYKPRNAYDGGYLTLYVDPIPPADQIPEPIADAAPHAPGSLE